VIKEKEMKRLTYIVVLVFVACSNTIAANNVTRASGGSIKTELGYGIVLNKESSLQREWITVHDDAIPADLVGTAGVKTIFEKEGQYSRGDYKYTADYAVKLSQDLVAIEVRFLTFDIWGNLQKSFSTTEIADLKSGDTRRFDAKWNVFSESEVSEYYASIAYIAQVRTKSGRVIKADPKTVIQEAQKFSAKFNASDLEPEPKKK
jgi:hypothetical protein